MTEDSSQRIVSLIAAARIVGVDSRTLRLAVIRGELPSATLIDRRYLILLSEAQAWAEVRRTARCGQPERRGRPPRLPQVAGVEAVAE